MNKELKIIATVVAKAECNDEVLSAIERVVEGTHTEEGNISYQHHRDIANPLRYVILEHWSSREAIKIHNATAHFQRFKEEIDGKIESLDVVTVECL